MASPKKDLLEFEKAIDFMDPMQVTEYLQKILDFLNRNNTELCFPNISSYTEAFLVRLVTETKNLKSKSLNLDNGKLGVDIIDVLEMNRDVFRWTHAYECGKQNKNLLVYKKIFSNKLKMKPAEHKVPTSIISQRLAKAQSQSDTPACSKIQLLNMTLRFIKNTSESTLLYPEMPLTQAQYIYSLLKNPKSDLNVGFGYKSLCAPLFEALEAHGSDYVFEMSFIETNKCDTASLKLEKKPKKDIKDSSRDESSLNSSTSSTNKSTKKPDKKNPSIKKSFITNTLKRLINFTEDSKMASVTFQQINNEQITFIKGMKTLAGSPDRYGSLERKFGDSLRQLNSNIIEVMKTCRLRIEEGVDKKNCRFLTVKKIPKEAVASTSERAAAANRSQSVPSKNTRDRSLSKERIKFESGGKLDLNNPTINNSTTTATEPKTEQPKATDKKERGRSTERLNARKAKLLEDMSVPLESDRGIRMMLLMGWNGGALGARGDGILEPIVPSIELPPGAGLGHVPPPKPEKTCALLLQNILDLFTRNLDTKQVEFKAPLPKKERAFITTLVKHFNKRSMLSLGVREEVEMFRQIMQAMIADVQIVIAANLDKDHKKITLTKSRNASQKSIAKIVSKLNKRYDLDEPSTMTVLTPRLEHEVITEESVNIIIENVIPTINTPCKTPVAIKNRATRILVLQRFINLVQSDAQEREFRLAVKLQKRIDPFLKDVISCVNTRGRSSHVTAEEMCYFDHLTDCSVGWILTLAVISGTQFILSKKPYLPEYQKRFYNSSWPQPADNNNDKHTNNKNQTDSCAKNDDVIVISDEEEEKILTIVVKEEERRVKLEKVAKIETECDIRHKDNDVNVKEVVTDIKKKDVGIDENNKDVDIDKNNKDVGIDKNNKDVPIEIKKRTETDDELSDSLCVCDTDVDICELDKDIQDLELAIFESDLDFEVKKENSNISPTSKRSRTNSINSQETSIKRSKITIKNCLIISPKDPEQKINTEIVKTIQTRMSEEFDKCTYFLPLLKCHGIQKEGLIYNCHDDNDVEWLEKIINDVDLDLKVCKSGDDFCIEQQSHKMVIKINSFIPVEYNKFFKRLETYNNGLKTALWKVLAEQTYESFVFIIVEVDENSFKYISKDNFALYVGIDKAQFSVIY